MTPGVAALIFGGVLLAAGTHTDIDAPVGPGARVESQSYTPPAEIGRCIAYNIGRKMPDLRVRARGGETADDPRYLMLTDAERRTFGVIRVEPGREGSHLTTWLAETSLTGAPEDIARRLVAGC